MTERLRDVLARGVAAGLAAGGVHLIAAPQDERRPRLVLQLVDESPGHTFDGAGGYSTGRVQVTALAPTYRAAWDLARAAEAAVGAADWGVSHAEVEGLSDTPLAPLAGRAVPQFGVQCDVTFIDIEEEV